MTRTYSILYQNKPYMWGLFFWHIWVAMIN